ncbi:unnamed protein product [Adineta steineri]|uniref:Putative auto-transporter adhesin head GIN domain-containing protein n=1 Tax=Adineta steineri TaxID=433720 RepID=A0A813RDP5_9BILA|nr:unnamed protein product [Adineta steineri]CAF3797727.1 unnamed protein product [Adineta steineri]
MIIFSFYFLFLIHLINGQQGIYNMFMPDLPPLHPRVPSSSNSLLTRETHTFTTRSFTKINLSGGPFNVKLYHNTNSNDNYTSVEVEAEQSLHKLISIDIIQNDILTIRMVENLNINNNHTNITLIIIYRELTELYIDGLINVQCVNQIQTHMFRLHHRGTGSIKLKLHVNILDAYLHSIGRIKLCGQVNDDAILKSLGVGDVDCRNLLTKKINVISSGIGNIYITAIDEINITLSGIGTVYYSGPLKQQIKTGLGNIMEMPINDQQIFNQDLD